MIKKLLSHRAFKYLVVYLSGCISALAFAPFYFFIGAIIGFSVFLTLLAKSQAKKQSFWLGYFFGFGHFTVGLYWISNALHTDIETFSWLIPFAIIGIPSILAFYIALCGLAFHVFARGKNHQGVIFGVIWLIAEIARGYLFTGFPWNLAGYSWGFSLEVMQIASIFGIWGLSLLAVWVFTSPIYILCEKNITAFAFIIGLAASAYMYGYVRLGEEKLQTYDGVKVRLVQASIPQDQKWLSENRQNIVSKHIELSTQNITPEVKYIIWSESSVPHYINQPALLKTLKQAIPEGGALITGALRGQFSQFGFLEKIWNSMVVIDHEGRLVDYYDKSHLVPFGEYIPFRNILPFKKITHGYMDFSNGGGLSTIKFKNFPSFSPLICYEAIFPGQVVNENERPELLINITNDAWYGDSPGPYQHFETVRMRAIEEGIATIRVANSGISAIIDPYGKIISKLKLEKVGYLDVSVHKPIASMTVFSKYGLTPIIAMVLVVLLLIRLQNSRKKNSCINR